MTLQKASLGLAVIASTSLILGASPRPARAADFTLKVAPGVAVPLADPQASRFGVGGSGGLRVGLELNPWLVLQLDGTYVGLPAKAASPSQDVGASISAGGGVRLQAAGADSWVVPWLDGDALYVRTGGLDRFGFSVGAGVELRVGESRSFTVGPFVRYLQITQSAMPGFDTADAKLLLAGLELGVRTPRVPPPPPPPPDRDGDGVPDASDRCPDQAGLASLGGCPDRDKDGIADRDDKCPDEPGPPELGGCPVRDQDKDGIVDKDDKCPTEPGPAATGGCPDRDGDGIADKDDKCPDQPGPAELGGCPDRDKDTVVDKDDRCPDVPGPADNQGCPRYTHVVVTQDKLILDQKIFFAFNKSNILPKSFSLLDEVVKALKDSPDLKVRVEGHTDSVGGMAHNMKLSDGRAASVRQYLVEHGIAPERIESKGYGPTAPLETNKTPAGRERNRRVEFVIIK